MPGSRTRPASASRRTPTPPAQRAARWCRTVRRRRPVRLGRRPQLHVSDPAGAAILAAVGRPDHGGHLRGQPRARAGAGARPARHGGDHAAGRRRRRRLSRRTGATHVRWASSLRPTGSRSAPGRPSASGPGSRSRSRASSRRGRRPSGTASTGRSRAAARITSPPAAPAATVLERNPKYTGPRPHRPQRERLRDGPADGAGGRTARRRIDRLRALRLRHARGARTRWCNGSAVRSGQRRSAREAQRYFRSPAPGVDLLAFNTRRPLFRDVNVRRAVNEALDRPAVIAVWGDAPDDRYVPRRCSTR